MTAFSHCKIARLIIIFARMYDIYLHLPAVFQYINTLRGLGELDENRYF